MRASRRTAAIAAAVAALLLALVLARHVVVRLSLSTVLSAATGYRVTFRDQRVGSRHAAFFDVHVSKNGDSVFDARRVDVDYALRDVFPGGAHRYGFAAISVQRPVITLTRHADGTLTFSRPGGTGAAPPPPARRAAAPYYFTARVRDGTIRLVDEAPLQADLAVQTIENVSVDASVKSDQRTTARVAGVWVGRRAQNAPVERYPVAERTLIDVHRGIGLHRITARELPLRGALGFFIHSRGIRFDDGVIDGVRVDVYALAPHAGDPMRYSVGGGMNLRGGRIFVAALAAPVRGLAGHIGIADDTMTADTLHAEVAGLPLHGRGAFFHLTNDPSAWLGIAGDGDIASLRALFAFARNVPLAGPLHVETLLAAKLDDPLIRNAFVLPHVTYERMRIDAVDGVADVFHDAVVVHAVHARFGALDAALAGRIMIDARRGDDIVFAVDASGPGSALPYADMLAPDATVHADALLSEVPGVNGWLARGAIDATGATDGGMTFAVNERGVGEFGPLAFTRRDGSSLAGGFTLERPISQSAGWLAAHDFRLGAARAAPLPGVVIPGFPPLSGVIDGTLVAGGTPDAFGVAGRMRARDLRYDRYDLGSGSVDLDGTFDDLRLANVAVDGPLGRFRGSGAVSDDVVALDGDYAGNLAALQPFFGAGVTASGGVDGPVRATIATAPANGEPRIVVQTAGAALRDARIRGIPVERIAGTMIVRGTSLRVVAADALVGGGRAVVADAGGPFLVSAPDIPAAALAPAGLPLQAGQLALFGLADLTGPSPRFDGAVALEDGRAAGFPVSGGADVAFDGRTAAVNRGIAAFGGTYGEFGGSIGIAGGAPSYDLAARVPLGDIGDIRRALRLPPTLRTLEGSFTANVRVGGSGARPRIAGRVRAPEGTLNGLAFRDAGGTIDAAPGALVARAATVTVGSTRAAFDASVAGRAFAVDVRSDAANLADFDDAFDAAETLAGTGRLAFALANDGRTTRTSGRFALSGVRYRQFPFGMTTGSWSQSAGRVTGALDVFGPRGELRANGRVITASGGPIRAFTAANVELRAAATKVDLGAWLPAFGITEPILGTVDATANVAGRWPRLATRVAATLRNGSLYGLPVQQGVLHAQSDGARIALSDTVLDLGFARFGASGSFGLARTDPLALAIAAQTPDIGRALATVEPRRRIDVAGALQAEARIGGTMARPRATVGFDLTDARYRNLVVPRVLGSVGYDGRTLDVLDAEATFAKGNVFLAGTLPLALRPFGLRAAAPFSVTLAADGLDLAPFAPFVPTANTTLGGTLNGRLALEGTSDDPRVVGTLTLAGGSYRSDFDRAPITGANARVTFGGTSVALEALHANVGGGTVDGNGSMELPFSKAPARGYAIGIVAHNAGFALPQYASGRVDGTLHLSRGDGLPLLSGDVTVSNTSVPFSAIVRDITAPRAATEGGPPFDLAFGLVAHAGKNVRVQGSIIDVGAAGTLALGGTLQAPKLDGTLTATPGGVFSTYNHAFRIQQASVTFDPENGVDPFIDARAFAHVTNPDPNLTRNAVGSADITITVRGPASVIASGGGPGGDYGISYSSNPPYDPEQIVGLLLDASVFGAINFGQQQNGTLLPGAPSETNALLPPGVTPYQAGVLNFNQEAFSILNGQLVQRLLAPVERVLTGPLGLSDLELTVDYGGGVGYAAYKQIGRRDVYANFGQTLTAPNRVTMGFTARPDATTSVLFSYYQQSGVPAVSTVQPFGVLQRLKGISPLASPGGFTFSIVRKYP